MIEINITDVYCFVFTDLRSYAGNKYEHFVTNNSINEIQFINFYHKLYVLPTLCKETSCFTAMAATMFYIQTEGLFLCMAPFVVRNVLD